MKSVFPSGTCRSEPLSGSWLGQDSTRLVWLVPPFLLLVFAACTQSASIPDRFTSDRDSLTSAFSAFHKANELTQPPPGESSFEPGPQQERQITKALERGLRAGHSVDDDFLRWLHPDMRFYFREKFMQGQQLYYEGRTEGSVAKQVRGNQLIGEFYSQFWEDYGDELTNKALGETTQGASYFQFVVALLLLGLAYHIILAVLMVPTAFVFTLILRTDDRQANFQTSLFNQIIVNVLYAAILATAVHLFISQTQPSAGWLYAITGFAVVYGTAVQNMQDKQENAVTSPSGFSSGASQGAAIGGTLGLLLYWVVFFWPELLLAVPGGATALNWSLQTASWLGGFWFVQLLVGFFALGFLLNTGFMLLLGGALLAGGAWAGLKRLFGVEEATA